jgi:ribosomal protein L32
MLHGCANFTMRKYIKMSEFPSDECPECGSHQYEDGYCRECGYDEGDQYGSQQQEWLLDSERECQKIDSGYYDDDLTYENIDKG